MLYNRGVILNLKSNYNYQISKNQTIMDLAIRYVKVNGLGEKELIAMNFVRLVKKSYLPFELVGNDGKSRI